MPVSDPTESPVDLAKKFVRERQPLLAIELLEPWLAEYPGDASAWSVMAGARYELDNLGEARIAAAKAPDLRPESARNWCNYGMILRKLGEYYEAERALHRALSIDSTYDRARTELRKIHELRTGDRSPITDDDFV
jgi:tetratricopeptide (TPR) repeat protein